MSIKRFRLNELEQKTQKLYEELGSHRKVADALGVSKTAVSARLNAIKLKKLSQESFTPANDPEGFSMTKTTVQYDADGKPVREWRRLSPQAQSLEMFSERLCESVKGNGKSKKYKPRKTDSSEQLLEIAISDPHIGMFAWGDETGQGNYDVEIATNAVLQAVTDISSRVRPAKTMLVFNGDTIHSDNRANKTELSGNVLDVDGRFARVLDHTVKCVIESINICSTQAKEVEVLVTPGNHDWHTATCLSRILHAYYHDAKNVNVIVTARPRYAMQWGDCMLAWAHGDKIKAADWSRIIPTEFPEMWGRTKSRFLHLGHIHHKKSFSPVMVDEQCGLVVEYLSALCQTDAWHAESGYIGTIRGADGYVYNHKGCEAQYHFNAEPTK